MSLPRSFLHIVGALVAAIALWMIAAPVSVMTEEMNAQVVDELAEAWLKSGHADLGSETFRHWDEEEGQVVPVACAKCHSGVGFRDYIGADGSAAGVVDQPAPIHTVVDCATCHNKTAAMLTSVTFPSGVTVPDLGASARCFTCHQGLGSTVSVNKAVDGKADDTVSEDLRFINIHYLAAGASSLGTEVKGGYEYEGKSYAGVFAHRQSVDECIECHDPHSLEVKVEICTDCHTEGDVEDIRMTRNDMDGDGDVQEGMIGEIATLQEALLTAIQEYAASVAGTPIIYDEHAYPYFFVDKNANGAVDQGEAIFPNAYKSWTPRLVRATYNLHYSYKDPGIFVHNPHYAMQILYDSIEDLGTVDMAGMVRP